MAYRVGLPGWKLAARLGIPLKFVVQVHEDEETHSFWASSDHLDGLVVSGNSLAELRREVMLATESLLDLALHTRHRPPAKAELRFGDDTLCAA